jgi:hypothetical protein
MTVRNFVKTTAEYKKLENPILYFLKKQTGVLNHYFCHPSVLEESYVSYLLFSYHIFYFGLSENVKET